jgi:Cu(I)/Ag(I) efflux system membrane fusion protein
MNRPLLGAVLVLSGGLLAAGGFYAGRHGAGSAAEGATAGAASAPAGPRVLYWHDPMMPGPRFDKPGKSPFMDMQLVPVYAGEGGDPGVKVSPALQQNLGIRLAPVQRKDVSTSFDALGTVQFDERLNVAVQSRVAGYVEQLAVRAPMEQVRAGQALATLYAPEWLGPQNEWLALQRAGVPPELVAAARDRLRAMSIPDALVRQSEAAGSAQARYTLTAPAAGVIVELGVREGVAVTPGMTLFRIAGLQKVWAVAEIPESQAVRLVRGLKVQAVLQADPSEAFAGVLSEVLPQISASTRSLQARFEVDNPRGRLTPGLLLRLRLAGATASRLLVPSEAVIRTGQRALVFVRQPAGAFESRDVTLGPEFGDDIEVLTGLAEGEQVVASGQFLIDSEASLRSVTGNTRAPPSAASAAASAGTSAAAMPASGVYVGEGKVESLQADGLTITHGPIAALNWPAMTMDFGKPRGQTYADIQAGDSVRFEFRKGGPMAYELVAVRRIGGSR